MNKEIKPYRDLSLQDIEGEEWRDIEGYEGYYMVSNMGRVKSLERVIYTKDCERARSYKRLMKEKILSLRLSSSQAFEVTLCLNSINKSFSIRYLVKQGFDKKRQKDDYIIHIDGDRTNSFIENLKFIHKDEFLSSMNRKNQYVGLAKNPSNSFTMSISINGGRIRKVFKTELQAAHAYDNYIKKHNLKRKGNFI